MNLKILKPMKKQNDDIEMKTTQSVPLSYRSKKKGMSMYKEKKINKFPTTNNEDLKLFIIN